MNLLPDPAMKVELIPGVLSCAVLMASSRQNLSFGFPKEAFTTEMSH